MASPAEKARLRREKILANEASRNKLLSGEIKTLSAATPSRSSEADASVQSTPVFSAKVDDANKVVDSTTPKDARPAWEIKYEKDAAVVKEKREISAETIAQLEVTQKLAVEAPRAAEPINKRSVSVQNTKTSFLPNIKLDSVILTVLVIVLGYLSGVSNGQFISENVYLPLGSFVLFALFMRVVVGISFRRLGLVKTQSANTESSGLLGTAMKFLPPPISDLVSSFRMVSGYFKDAYDDMMLFVFAHGIASRLAVSGTGDSIKEEL